MKSLLLLTTTLLSAGWFGLPPALTADAAKPANDARCDAVFHQPLRMKELFAPLAYLRAQTLDGREVEVLEARMPGGAVERLYFGADNGLLVRRDSEFAAAAGRVKTESLWEDYRAVDGVRQPHLMRLKIEAADQAPMELQITITALRQNVTLPANVFAKPQ